MVPKSLLLIILLASIGYCDTGFKNLIRFTETDGSPSCMAGQVKVSAGSLTCSGNVATVTTGAGSGGGGGGGGNPVEVLSATSRLPGSSTETIKFSSNFTGTVSGSTMTVDLSGNQTTINTITSSFTVTGGGALFSNAGLVNPLTVQSTTKPYLRLDENQANAPQGEIDFTTLLSTNTYLKVDGTGFHIGNSTQTNSAIPTDRILITAGATPSITMNPNGGTVFLGGPINVSSNTILPGTTFYQNGNATINGLVNVMNLSSVDTPMTINTGGQPGALTLWQPNFAGNYNDYIYFAWSTQTNYKGKFGMDMFDYTCTDGVSTCALAPFIWKGADGLPSMSFDQSHRMATGKTWTPSINYWNHSGNMSIGSWLDISTAPVNGFMVSGNSIFGSTNTLAISATSQVQITGSTNNTYSFVVSTSGAGPFDLSVTTMGVTAATSLIATTQLTVPIVAGYTPTTSGHFGFDSISGNYLGYIGSASRSQSFVGVIFSSAPDNDILVSSNTASETAFQTQFTFPANFWKVGRTVRVTLAQEHIGTATIPTQLYKLRFQKSGPTNVNIWQGVAAAQSATATFDQRAAAVFYLVCTTAGASAVVRVGTITGTQPFNATNLSAISPSFDGTADQALQLTGTWGASTTGNTDRLSHYIVEVLQ